MCAQVTTCLAGEKVTAAPTPSSDRQCASCPAKQFQTNENQDTCASLTLCQQNEFMSVGGTSTSDRKCSPCPNGTLQPAQDHHRPRCEDTTTTETSSSTSTATTTSTSTDTTADVGGGDDDDGLVKSFAERAKNNEDSADMTKADKAEQMIAVVSELQSKLAERTNTLKTAKKNGASKKEITYLEKKVADSQANYDLAADTLAEIESDLAVDDDADPTSDTEFDGSRKTPAPSNGGKKGGGDSNTEVIIGVVVLLLVVFVIGIGFGTYKYVQQQNKGQGRMPAHAIGFTNPQYATSAGAGSFAAPQSQQGDHEGAYADVPAAQTSGYMDIAPIPAAQQQQQPTSGYMDIAPNPDDDGEDV